MSHVLMEDICSSLVPSNPSGPSHFFLNIRTQRDAMGCKSHKDPIKPWGIRCQGISALDPQVFWMCFLGVDWGVILIPIAASRWTSWRILEENFQWLSTIFYHGRFWVKLPNHCSVLSALRTWCWSMIYEVVYVIYIWYIYIYYIRNNTYNLYETRSWHPWRGVLQSCERSLASWISCNTCAETPKWPSPPSNFSFTITTARRAKSFPSSSWKRCAGCGNPQHQMQYIWNTTYWIAAQSSSRRIPQIGCVYYGCQFCEKTWKLQKCCWGTEISRALCPKWFPPSSGHSIYHSFNPSLTKSLWLSVTPSSWLGGKAHSYLNLPAKSFHAFPWFLHQLHVERSSATSMTTHRWGHAQRLPPPSCSLWCKHEPHLINTYSLVVNGNLRGF